MTQDDPFHGCKIENEDETHIQFELATIYNSRIKYGGILNSIGSVVDLGGCIL